MANRWGNNGRVADFIFLGSKITADGDCSHEIKGRLLLGRKAMTNLDSILKSRAVPLPTKVHTKLWFFQWSCMDECWAIKKAEHWRTDTFELWCWRTFESPLDCKEVKSINPKGNQSWMFIGRTDAEVEALILWPPDAKNWLTGKDPDAGKHWKPEEKGTTEDEMVGWHLQLDEHEFEQTLGVDDGQGSLVYCKSSWVRKELDTTERLNWTEGLNKGNF